VSEKAIFWVGSSLDDVRSFPEDVRRLTGHFLHLVQQGLEPPDWKPMVSVGQGVYEIRIHTRVEHRVFYRAKFSEGIYVLHAFQKKTRSTSASDIDLARRRLKQLVRNVAVNETKDKGRCLMKEKITRSSGNIFEDLGFPSEEAEYLKIRSTLMIHLRKAIEAKGLKQAEAAKLLGVTQPRVSDLYKGKIHLFSIDTLVDMLARVGVHIKLVVGSSKRKLKVT